MRKKAPIIVSRGLEQSVQDYTLQRLKAGPIKHGSTRGLLPTLRAMKHRGKVEHEYDERGDLVWRLIAKNSSRV